MTAVEADRIVVSVADTGLGIAEPDLTRLFRIDEYHSNSGTQDEEGTGLGLILCKELGMFHIPVYTFLDRMNRMNRIFEWFLSR